jgi:polyhydroxyalkanoate synthesis regulator phasin
MPTNRVATSGRRIGLTKFIGNIVDDTKDFIDDVLDRARDAERDLRDTAQRTFRSDDEEEEGLVELQRQLDELTEKVARLSRSGQDQPATPN